MRRVRRFNGSNPNKILFAEFKFYNKTKKVLDENVLKEMERRLQKKETQIFWSNDMFAKNGIGFKFKRIKNKDETFDIYVSILEFNNVKITASCLNKTKWSYQNKIFLGYEPNDDQKEVIRHTISDGYSSISTPSSLRSPLMNWEKTIDSLIKYNILSRYENESDWDIYTNDMKVMFGETFWDNFPTEVVKERYGEKSYKRPKEPTYDLTGNGYYSNNAYHIVKVDERRIGRNNYRIALICRIDDYRPKFRISIFNDKSDEYVYIDEGRMFFTSNNTKYYLDDNVKEFSDEGIIVNKDIFKAMKSNIKEILPQGERVVPPNIYRFYKERVVLFERSKNDYRGKDSKEEQIIIQYKSFLDKGKIIKLNNTIISNKKIEVVGERFNIEFGEDFMNVSNNFGNIKKLLRNNDIRFNFNELYEKLLQFSVLKWVRMEYTKDFNYKRFTGVSFKVNGLPIDVSKDGNRMKINGIFCRINDVYHILTKIICYTNVDEFNKYVKEVSHIGIEWKQMISNGIAIELSNPFFSIFKRTGDTSLEKMNLRFSLFWDSEKRQKVYLLLNNNKYLIRYKGKFKRNFNLPRRVLTMSNLKKELAESVDNLDDETIIEIVENAVEEAKIIQKRGQELVVNTINEINAQDCQVVIDGNEVKGYKFKGRKSGTEYFIHKISLNVYRNDGGNWNRRCIVDDHTKQRIFEDKLANRLINIFNEPTYLKSFLGT